MTSPRRRGRSLTRERETLSRKSAPPPGTEPVRSPLTEFLRHAEVSMWAEGMDPVAARRVLNRLLSGRPDGPGTPGPDSVPRVPTAEGTDRFRAVLAQRLAFARKDAKLTQEDAAGWLNVARSSVSAMEHCQREVTAVELVLLALLYDRPLRWFTTFPDTPEVRKDDATGPEHGSPAPAGEPA